MSDREPKNWQRQLKEERPRQVSFADLLEDPKHPGTFSGLRITPERRVGIMRRMLRKMLPCCYTAQDSTDKYAYCGQQPPKRETKEEDLQGEKMKPLKKKKGKKISEKRDEDQSLRESKDQSKEKKDSSDKIRRNRRRKNKSSSKVQAGRNGKQHAGRTSQARRVPHIPVPPDQWRPLPPLPCQARVKSRATTPQNSKKNRSQGNMEKPERRVEIHSPKYPPTQARFRRRCENRFRLRDIRDHQMKMRFILRDVAKERRLAALANKASSGNEQVSSSQKQQQATQKEAASKNEAQTTVSSLPSMHEIIQTVTHSEKATRQRLERLEVSMCRQHEVLITISKLLSQGLTHNSLTEEYGLRYRAVPQITAAKELTEASSNQSTRRYLKNKTRKNKTSTSAESSSTTSGPSSSSHTNSKKSKHRRTATSAARSSSNDQDLEAVTKMSKKKQRSRGGATPRRHRTQASPEYPGVATDATRRRKLKKQHQQVEMSFRTEDISEESLSSPVHVLSNVNSSSDISLVEHESLLEIRSTSLQGQRRVEKRYQVASRKKIMDANSLSTLREDTFKMASSSSSSDDCEQVQRIDNRRKKPHSVKSKAARGSHQLPTDNKGGSLYHKTEEIQKTSPALAKQKSKSRAITGGAGKRKKRQNTLIMEAEAIAPSVGHMRDVEPSEDDERFNNGIITVEKETSSIKARRRERRRKQESGPEQTQCVEEKTVEASFISERKHSKKKFQSRRSSSSSVKDGKALRVTENKVPVEALDEMKNTNCMDEERQIVDKEAGSIPERKRKTKKATERCPPVPNPAESAIPANDSFEKKSTRSRNKSRQEEVEEARPIPERKRRRAQNSVITSQNSGAEGKDLCVTESDTPVDVTMEKKKSKHRDEEKQAEKIYRKRDKRSQNPSRQTESSATASDETATVPSVDQTERCEASGESSKERKNQRGRAKKYKKPTKDITNEITQPLETTEERFAVEEELETRCARKKGEKVSDPHIQPQSEVENGDDHSGEYEIFKKANSPPSSAKILPEKCKAARRQHRARKTSQKSSVTGLSGPTSSASSRKTRRGRVDAPKTDATSTIEPSGEEEFVEHKVDTIKPQDMYAEIESSSLESVSIRKEGKIQKQDPSPSDADAGVLMVRGAFKSSQSSSKTDKEENQDGYDSNRRTLRKKTKSRGLLEMATAVSNTETESIENKEDATICTSTNVQERRKRRAKKNDRPKFDLSQKGQAAVTKVTMETPHPAWSVSKDDTKSSEEMNPDGKQVKKQKRKKSTTTAKESNKADDEAHIPSCAPKRHDQIEFPTDQVSKVAKGTKKKAKNNLAPEKSESKKADTPNKCEVEEHLIMRAQVTQHEFRPTDSTVLSRNTSSKQPSAELAMEELTSEDDLDDFCTSMFSNSQRDVQDIEKELEIEIGTGPQKKPDLLGDVIEDTEQPLTCGETPGHENTEVQPKEEDSTRKEKENEKVDDDKEAPPTDDATLVESDQPSTTAKRSSVWKKITKKPALFKKKKHHASSSNSDETGVMSKTDSEPESTNMTTASKNETVTVKVAEKNTEADSGRSDDINYTDDVQKANCKTSHKMEQTKQSASTKETENEAGQNVIICKESPSPNATMNDKKDTCEQAEELNDNSTEQEPSTKQVKNFEGKKEKKEKKTKIKMEGKERKKEKTEKMKEKKKEKKLAKEKKKEEKNMEKEEKKMEKEEKKKEKAEKKKKAQEEKKETKEKKMEKKEEQNKEEEEKNKEKEEKNKEIEQKNTEKEEKKQEKEKKRKGKGKNKEKTMEEKEEMKEKKTQKKEEKKKNKAEKKKKKEEEKEMKKEKKVEKKEKKVEKKEEKKEKNKEKKEEKQAKKDKTKVKEEKKEKKEEKKEKKKQKKEEKKAKKLMKGDDGEIADDAKSTPDGKTKKKRKGLGKLLKGKKVKQTKKSYPTPPASDVEIPAAQPVVARCRMVAPVPATDIKHDLRLPAALVNSDCDAEPMDQETSGKTTSIPASATSELKQSSPEMKAADVTAGWCEAVTTNIHRTTGVQRTLDGQTAIKHVRFADATGTNDVQDETKQNQVSRFQSEPTVDSDEWYDSDGDAIATERKETKSTQSNRSYSSLRNDKSASLLEPKEHPDSKRDTERPIVPNKQSLDSHDDSSSCARLSRQQQRKQMWTEILQELSSPDESPSQPDKAHDILKYDTESKMVIPPGNTPVPSKPLWLETSSEDQPQVDQDDDSMDDGIFEKSAPTNLPQRTSKVGRGTTIKNIQPCQIESTIIESIKERAKEVSAPSAEHDIMKPSRDEIAPTSAKETAADTVIKDIENSDSWDDDDEGEKIKKIEVKEEVVSKPPSASKQLETDYNSWDEESDQEEEDKKQKKSGKTSKEIDMMDELLRELSPSDDENEFGGWDGRMSRSAFHRSDFIMDQDEETDEPNDDTSESTRSKPSHMQQSPEKYKSDELDTIDQALKTQVSSNSKHDACADSSFSTKTEEVFEEIEEHEEQDLTELDAIEEMLRHSSSDDLFGIVDKMPRCKTSKPTPESKTVTSPVKPETEPVETPKEETISETNQEANDNALKAETAAISSTHDILVKPTEQITSAPPLTSEPKSTVSATKKETKPMDSSQKVLNSKTNREESSADLAARTRDESSICDIVESAGKPGPLEKKSSLTPSHVLESDKSGEVTRKRRITFSDVPRGPTTPGQRRGPLKGVLKRRPEEFLHDLIEAQADHKYDVVNRDALSELADTKSRQEIVISSARGEERLGSYASIEAEGRSWLTEMYPDRTDLYSPKTNEETQSPPESESEDSSTTTIDLDADMDDIKWSEAFCSDEEADVSPTKKAGTSRDHIRIQSLESSSESYEAPSSLTPRDLDGEERKLSRALLDGETDVFPPKNAGTARDDIRSPSLESSSESDEAPSSPVHLTTTAEEMKPATNLLDERTQDRLRDSLIRAGKPDSASAFQEAEIPRYLRDDFSPAPEQKPFKRWDPMTAKKKLEKITKSKKKLPESPTPRWLNTDFSPDGSAPKREVWKAPKDKPVLCSTPEAAADNSEFDYASMTPKERYNGRQQIANESQKIIDSMRNQDKFQQSSKTATTPPPSTPSQDNKDLPRFLRADFNPAPDQKPLKKWNPVQAKKTFTKIGNKAKLQDAAKTTASPVSGTQSSAASADTPRWMQPDFDPSKAAPATARPPPKESFQAPPPQMNTLPQYELEPQIPEASAAIASQSMMDHQIIQPEAALDQEYRAAMADPYAEYPATNHSTGLVDYATPDWMQQGYDQPAPDQHFALQQAERSLRQQQAQEQSEVVALGSASVPAWLQSQPKPQRECLGRMPALPGMKPKTLPSQHRDKQVGQTDQKTHEVKGNGLQPTAPPSLVPGRNSGLPAFTPKWMQPGLNSSLPQATRPRHRPPPNLPSDVQVLGSPGISSWPEISTPTAPQRTLNKMPALPGVQASNRRAQRRETETVGTIPSDLTTVGPIATQGRFRSRIGHANLSNNAQSNMATQVLPAARPTKQTTEPEASLSSGAPSPEPPRYSWMKPEYSSGNTTWQESATERRALLNSIARTRAASRPRNV